MAESPPDIQSTERLVQGRLALDLTWKDGLIHSIRLAWADSEPDRPACLSTSVGRELDQALDRYLNAKLVSWPDLPLDWARLTPFSRLVLQTLATISPGQVTSYGQLASRCGRPEAARAVGRVMASNPWPLVVPCHRVIGSTGSLTGFGPGLEMKRFLLDLETASQGFRPWTPAGAARPQHPAPA